MQDFYGDERVRHSAKALETTLALSVARLERIENKAMGTLFGVGVAIALFSGAAGLLGANGPLAGQPDRIRLTAGLLILLAMVYLFGSGFLALWAYQTGKVYRPSLMDRAPLVDQTSEATALLHAIEQNNRAATLRSNRLVAAFTCLRNGLLVVLALAIMIVFVHLPF